MIIYIIAAVADNRVIGRGGAIPWDIPADRRRFRELTMGHTVIMGRKTFESIGRPLAGRTNIILSRNEAFRADGCSVAGSLEDALLACPGADEVIICGGEGLYRQAIPLAAKIFLTVVHQDCDGDAFFPPIPAPFVETERSECEGGAPCTFIVYTRMISGPETDLPPE
jgi:dihydrofolate reductase